MDIFSIFTLLGGLAFFIYGMNQMSGRIESDMAVYDPHEYLKQVKSRNSSDFQIQFLNYNQKYMNRLQ